MVPVPKNRRFYENSSGRKNRSEGRGFFFLEGPFWKDLSNFESNKSTEEVPGCLFRDLSGGNSLNMIVTET